MISFQNILGLSSIELPSSQIIGLMGPSGIGKTTFLEYLIGVKRQPMTGTLTISQEDDLKNQKTFSLSEWENTPPFFFLSEHQATLLPWLTVEETLELYSTDKDLISHLLDSLEIDPKRYPYEFSAGMKARVEIAKSLCTNRACLLFDEPFVHLDERLRKKTKHLIQEDIKKKKRTALIVSHWDEDFDNIATNVYKASYLSLILD